MIKIIFINLLMMMCTSYTVYNYGVVKSPDMQLNNTYFDGLKFLGIENEYELKRYFDLLTISIITASLYYLHYRCVVNYYEKEISKIYDSDSEYDESDTEISDVLLDEID